MQVSEVISILTKFVVIMIMDKHIKHEKNNKSFEVIPMFCLSEISF